MAKEVKVKCGTVDSTYQGVANPVLDAVYLQTEEEEKKYGPIMKDLLENGLSTDGATTISGI